MHLSSTLLPLLLSLTTLVASDACVAGGPATAITAAKNCCLYVGAGTWYQFYPVQAICVLAASRTKAYSKCVDDIPGTLDTECIPGDGGLSGGATATATSAGQGTLTARRF